jgi:hypothetical protein
LPCPTEHQVRPNDKVGHRERGSAGRAACSAGQGKVKTINWLVAPAPPADPAMMRAREKPRYSLLRKKGIRREVGQHLSTLPWKATDGRSAADFFRSHPPAIYDLALIRTR